MRTMMALRFESYGPPSALSVRSVDVRDLEPGEALVEVRASAVNPSDVKNIAGVFNAALPRTPGRDYAGLVVGGDARKGEEVWGSGAGFGITRDGSHAQYLIVASDWLSRKPATLTMEQAAAIGTPYLAGWSALVDAAKIEEGETVLITGVSGAVGRAASQIAHWKKAKVIGADHSDRPNEADVLINVNSKDLLSEVRTLTDGKGVDLVLDAVGGPLFEPCLNSLRVGGRQVAITSIGSRRVELDLVDFYHGKRQLIGVDTMKLGGPEIARLMNSLRVGFEQGHLRPPDVEAWPLDASIQAYEFVAKGGTATKHVVLPHLRSAVR